MKTKIYEGLAFSAMLMLSSCATIFNGGAPLVTIEGDVDEPVTITTKKGVYQDVMLPVEVKVSQRHIEGQHIQIQSDNHEFDDIVLQKKLTWWTLANIPALQNLSGFLVDWATNTNVTPRYNHFLIHPKGEGELLRSTELFHMDVPVNRPHANDFYRHEVSVNVGAGSVIENEFYDAIDQHVTPHGFDEDDAVDGESFTLPLSIDYMYNLNRRLGVGINIGWASISETKYKWELMQIAGENILYIYGVDPESHAFYVLPTVRYKWWISRNNRLAAYSKLALGYARTKFNVDEVTDYFGNTLLPAYSTTRHRLGYQFTFAGMEFGRGHLRSFVELGYGYKGFFNTGLKLCF